MLRTTLGQLLINRALPEDMRDYHRTIDKSSVGTLFEEIAKRYPERYRDIVKQLSDVGREAAYETGDFSFGLDDLQMSPHAKLARIKLRREIDGILQGPGSAKAKQDAIVESVGKIQQALEKKIYEESLASGNPLARQIVSGARGSASNLKRLRGFDGLYTDNKGRVIPIPVLRSYSEGLTPAEYFAGAFGARQGVVATKFSTADSGYWAKQAAQATHRLIVTERDDDDDRENLLMRGMPVDVDDADSVGALLAAPTGDFPRNTEITPRVLRQLQQAGVKRILVRSPITSHPLMGGIYARDAGVRERGGLPPRGDFVGLAAAQAAGEKLSQAQLGQKHAGGVAGASNSITGFKLVNQLTNVPKHFPGGISHAQLDGRVRRIVEAPQGGHYIDVGATQHYVPVGRTITVKPGDDVEAGDALSDGVPNPAEIVAHKGIGEGRRYFAQLMRQAFKDSGLYLHRRNAELLSRGLIDHVQLTDEYDDYLPDDVVPYSSLERDWQPRQGSHKMTPRQAVGRYLERPTLHYSIGTRVTPSMLKDFEGFGVKEVMAHSEAPPFKPIMIRSAATLDNDPDWATRHLGSHLQKATLQAVHRGRSSDPAGTSFVPAAVFEPTTFGQKGLTKSWDPADLQDSG